MVEQESATIDGYPRISLPLDHSQLNKFGSLEDEGFRLVSSNLRKLVESSQSLLRRFHSQTAILSQIDNS